MVKARVALITCGPQLEVALSVDEQPAASLVRLAGVSRRSSLLLAAVDLLTEDAGISGRSISEVLVTRGPGSFTGIRAGLASAAGLAAATGAEVLALDSLLVQAGRCEDPLVWAAQPGRRGELYAQPFRTVPDAGPVALQPIQIFTLEKARGLGPWAAADQLDLGDAVRASAKLSAAESLIHLRQLGMAPQPQEPLYVEGHPAQRPKTS